MSVHEQLSFIEIKKNTREFRQVELYFHDVISCLYGDQSKALQKIADQKDRSCEFLLSKNTSEGLGIIVYKNNLTQEFKKIGYENSFEIKTLCVINPIRHAGKKIATQLIHRTAQIATKQKATSVAVTVSSAKPESLSFFLGMGFLIEKVVKNAYIESLDEYYLFHPSPKKLLSLSKLNLLISNTFSPSLRLRNFSEEPFFLNSLEKLVIASYFQGKNINEVLNSVYEYFGMTVSATFILNVISKLRKHNLKWQSENLNYRYTILFLNPLYKDKTKKKLIGQLLIGMTPQAKKHVLGCFPGVALSQSYWLGIFQDLKNLSGIKEINILCLPPKIDLSLVINKLFTSTRITFSSNLRSWTIENLLPGSSATKLVNEMSHIQDSSCLAMHELECLVSSM